MKQLFTLSLFAFLICCCVFACKKNDGVNQNLDPNNQTGYDFMPNKVGNWWYYGSQNGVMYHRYGRNMDSMKMGLKYSYFERKDDTSLGFDPEYFGKNNGYYLTLIDLDGERTNYINYAFWKDSAGLGVSWNNTGSVNSPLGNVSILIESSVVEDGLTLHSAAKTFGNVMHVHSDAKGGPLNTRIGTLDIWFIKGIGVIREEAHINILNQFTMDHIDSLVDYHLEP